MGWMDDKIGETLGLNAPSISAVVSWVVLFALAATMLWAYHIIQQRFVEQPIAKSQTKPEPHQVIVSGLLIIIIGVLIVAFGIWQQSNVLSCAIS
jgi:NADH:ubiquinone oxidoreductase subunit 5 (subunit L)/multisubunit Na+/H+ antiporter MnhA subunit